MLNPGPGAADESMDRLCGDWNLAEDPANGAGLVDSLLAFRQSRSARRPGPPPTRSAAEAAGSRSQGDAELFLAFSLNGGDEPDEADTGARPGPGLGLAPEPGADAQAAAPVPLVLPRPGERLSGFQIVGELGRGAFARVYLARQESLGNRLVALKVSRAEGDEPQILARLQHTHIVPIHSVHDDPASRLRLMCMPFLGGANLAQVLEAAGARIPEQASGHSLVEALDVVSNRLQSASGLSVSTPPLSLAQGRIAPPEALTLTPLAAGPRASRLDTLPGRASIASYARSSLGPIHSFWTRLSGRGPVLVDPSARPELSDDDHPARQFLRQANHVQASVWIVARLAEGLDHAHSRGLLHRDLKPSNVLIAGDGTPMLLDFNLATVRRIRTAEEGTKAMLGGTLPYMAPEHLDAFHPKGTTPAEAVGEAADLYALGLILFEMIAGEHPFAEPRPNLPMVETIEFLIEQRRRAPSLRAVCPEVPWSLDAIVAKCLDPDPARRYLRARDLAEDLRRFLDDLPLKYTPEPSLRERLGKWTRRHPAATSSTSVALIAIVLLLAAGITISILLNSLWGISARLKYRTFQSAFQECQLLLNTTSGPVEHLGQGIALAQKTLDSEHIETWNDRRRGEWDRWLSPSEQVLLREQTVELILLEARARTYLAGKNGSEADQREALEWAVEWLDRAEKIDPHPTPALYGDRARYLAALGLADRAARDRKREAEARPTNSRDFALLGTSLLVKRDLTRAETALKRAVALDSRRFWAWFALGYCRFEQGRYLEAAGDFAVCTAIEPRFAWPYMNRGLALACAGRLEEARSAYDSALAANPKFTEALVNRALTRLELNDVSGAKGDLQAAIDLGRKEPAVLAAMGEVLARLGRRNEAETLYAGLIRNEPDNASYRIARAVLRLNADPEGARADLRHVLDRSPRNARALYVMARLVGDNDHQAALGFADAALEADPSLFDALQFRARLRAVMGNLAAVDDVERLVQAPTGARLYNAACILSILSHTTRDRRLGDRALALLARAFEAGIGASRAPSDPDLEPLRDRPEFAALVRKFRPVRRP
jgi:serine/threonine protein kinase/Tfp pilus assembly protein PilF